MDQPEMILKEAIENHQNMIKQFKGMYCLLGSAKENRPIGIDMSLIYGMYFDLHICIPFDGTQSLATHNVACSVSKFCLEMYYHRS